MPAKRRKSTDLQKKIKSLRLRIAELENKKSRHKQAENTLRDSEELYRTLVENIGLGINLIDTNYRIVMTNAAHAHLQKKARGKFVGNFCFKEFEKRNVVCPHCPGKKAMATGRPAMAETEGIGDDGSHLPVQIHAFPVFNTDGSAKGFIEVVEDLTKRRQAEEKLKESEQRFKAIFDNAADGILLADVKSKRLYLGNKAICKMLGCKPEEIKNMTVPEIHPKGQLSYAMKGFEKQIRGEITVAENIPVKRKNGSVFYADINSFPITLDGKKYLMGIFRDVTTHRQAEENLKESEERFKTIFDNAPDGILLADKKTKKFYLGNKAICSMLGYKTWEIKNLAVPDIHPKELLPSVLKQFARQVAREITVDEDVPVKRKDGGIFYADISAFPITFSGKTYIAGIFRDITERKKAEEALRESEIEIRAIFDQTFQFIGLMNIDGTLIEANRTALEFSGIDSSSVLNRPFWLGPWWTHSPELQGKLRQSIEKAARGEFIRFEATHVAKDGRLHYVDFSLKPVKDETGKVIFLIPEGRDITERKKIEEELNTYREKMAQAERLASLGTLSATIAHELTQPLTVIRLSIENSLEDLKAASCCKTTMNMLEDALKEVTNATSVIERFRNYARQSSRKTFCKTELGAIAERIIQLLGKTAQSVNMTLRLKGMDKLPPVYSNEKDIEQLFFALTENAIQAADGRKNHQFTISGKVKDENIDLRFADNCSGIAPENLGKIFDPFFTTGSDDGRTGLGLPIAQRILSEHRGKIRVKSRLGKGTTFYVTLPIHPEMVK